MYLAHSKDNEGNGLQSYGEHAAGVYRRSRKFLLDMLVFYNGDSRIFEESLKIAALLHDLGKLDEKSQLLLNGTPSTRKMINHTAAGTKYCMARYSDTSYFPFFVAAIMIEGHHGRILGYDSETGSKRSLSRMAKLEYLLRDKRKLKDCYPEYGDGTVDSFVSEDIERMVGIHKSEVCDKIDLIDIGKPTITPLDIRMMMSCLVEGDHGDTSINYGNIVVDHHHVDPRWSERRASLDGFVAALNKCSNSPRKKVRQMLYDDSCNVVSDSNFMSNNGVVGSGKSFATVRSALELAERHGMRRIFVLSPMTHILSQNVEALRDTVTLRGESRELSVGSHYSGANYSVDGKDSKICKVMNVLWDSPIIYTTCVQFMETLVSNRTTRLRKLNQVPGSVIVIDESHMAMPVKYMALLFSLLNQLVAEYNCKIIMASGSQIRFDLVGDIWEKAGIKEPIRQLVSEATCNAMNKMEHDRVRISTIGNFKAAYSFMKKVNSNKGSKLIVMNTVKGAANVAKYFANEMGSDDIYHVSNAMTQKDITRVLCEVRQRLDNGDEVILIGTSMVEVGLDMDFDIAMRERSSLFSLLQVAGRANRDGKNICGQVFDFSMNIGVAGINPSVQASSAILDQLFREGAVSSESCTEALCREITMTREDTDNMIYEEKVNGDFQLVCDEVRMITDDSYSILADPETIESLVSGKRVTKQEIDISSVKMNEKKRRKNEDLIKTLGDIKRSNGVFTVSFADEMEVYTGNYSNDYGIDTGP